MDDPDTLPPRDFDGFRSLLADRREQLPGRLVQVGEYAMRHPDEIAFGTTASIAQAAQVQPSTLVRFAKALGYQGFSDLQSVFQLRLRARSSDYRQRLSRLRQAEGEHGVGDLLDRFAAAAAGSLASLRESVRPEAVEAAAEILASAEIVHVLGLRRAFPVAAYLAYAFGQLGMRVVLVDHVGALAGEQVGGARDKDALVAVSFTPYMPTTVELTNRVAKSGAAVVAITDSPFSPLAAAARVRLDVVDQDVSGFRSLSATFCLATTLAVAVGERRNPPEVRA